MSLTAVMHCLQVIFPHVLMAKNGADWPWKHSCLLKFRREIRSTYLMEYPQGYLLWLWPWGLSQGILQTDVHQYHEMTRCGRALSLFPQPWTVGLEPCSESVIGPEKRSQPENPGVY